MTTSAEPASVAPRGRPRRASRHLLEEAAFELFLERGYANTTLDDIATRAGVSRNTFFNYFTAKDDVFWVEIDRALATLPQHLEDANPQLPIMNALGEALADTAAEFGKGVVPWILTNFETIGSPNEVMESALSRLGMYTAVIRSFVAGRLDVPTRDFVPQLIASTTVAAAVSATIAWGAAGVNRNPLDSYLLQALAPLAEGFSHVR